MTSPRRARRELADELDDDGGDGGAFSGLSGAANLRGGLLIAVAVVLGVVLLGKGFDSGFLPSASGDPSDQVATGDDDPDTDGDGNGDTDATTTSAPPTTRLPAEVRVQVLNSTAPIPGSAGDTTTVLSNAGYNVISASNADDRAATATIVYAASGFEADAAAVATTIGLTVTPQPMPVPPPGPAPADVNVVIILGPDFTPPDPAATTTAPAGDATTTTTG